SASGRRPDPREDGVLFRFLNTSKRAAAVDWTSASGRERVLDLAAGADIVVESLAPGTIEDLGLVPAAVWERNRRVTVVSISAFGRGGPWSLRPATEFTLQAWCGSTAARGTTDRPPLAAGGRLGEWLGGAGAAAAAPPARPRARPGRRGAHVGPSLLAETARPLGPHTLGGERR